MTTRTNMSILGLIAALSFAVPSARGQTTGGTTVGQTTAGGSSTTAKSSTISRRPVDSALRSLTALSSLQEKLKRVHKRSLAKHRSALGDTTYKRIEVRLKRGRTTGPKVTGGRGSRGGGAKRTGGSGDGG